MKLCAIETKELEDKLLTRFADNQNDELLEDLSDYVINSQKEIERLNNIINELNKELEDMATLKTDQYGNIRKITHIDINWLLIKIKELKGVEINNGK